MISIYEKKKIMKLKFLLFIALLFLLLPSYAQREHKTKNVVVILIDGYRWQELFKGADFDLLSDKKYNTGNDNCNPHHIINTLSLRRCRAIRK